VYRKKVAEKLSLHSEVNLLKMLVFRAALQNICNHQMFRKLPKISWLEAQGLLQPPLDHAPYIVAITSAKLLIGEAIKSMRYAFK
ncbi:hypothetical protein S83_036218, partial [Arachis hypogaea]